MNVIFRQFLKVGLEFSAKKNIQSSPQVVCFAHDVISRKIMIDGLFEKRELLALRRFLSAKLNATETCLDIGANIGNHSLFFADFFDEIISFEPNKNTFRVLEINANLTKNVQVVNLGLSDKADSLPAMVNSLNIGGARITTQENATTHFSVVALDDFLQNQPGNSINFMKIDVEGHELKALRGAKATLSKFKPPLAIEMHVKKDQENSLAILNFLEQTQYKYAYVFKRNFFRPSRDTFTRVPLSEFKMRSPKNYKMVVFTVE